MAVTSDMVAMWRRPARVASRHLTAGPREDRALAFLMAASFLTFLGRLPVLQRQAVLEGGDFTRDASYAFVSIMLVAPLAFYGIAALAGLIARTFGARVSGFQARMALFWAYLTVSPLVLFHGLLTGMTGMTPGVQLVGALGFAALVFFWIIGLHVAGREAP